MKRRRWRTIILVTGATLCVLIAAAFVVSGRWEVEIELWRDSRITLVEGCAQYDSTWWMRTYDSRWGMQTLSIFRHPGGFSAWNYWLWSADEPYVGVSDSRRVVVPLWSLFLVVAIPTLIVWRFWPKPPKPGHCEECGYNLHGLTEPRCPECGTGFDPHESAV